jgi:hypothetical protein
MSKYPRPEYPRKTCPHCECNVGVNAYARSHGGKCAYKNAPNEYKRCKICNDFIHLSDFNKSASSTYDGLNQACKECASIKKVKCPNCESDIILKYKDHKLEIK